ncbi:MAG: hypothetical protein GTO51_11190 [Candidatus Latescibacteria bacterium]|nr:hypothetical protein [Candidatus Latescibacterota bacterium]NIM66528.1 hypothetical protein [Candidatus Latescibacterota bacterium]NIO03008.1 hypothetical protein [Candidatus Latescibacterota bacterium]NIO30143.1 hypothetical protein [Candidatus Latescibacterota bacterium]NIO57762.1 hypothetical protein [Candidatus Latescibacterota bacterium]
MACVYRKLTVAGIILLVGIFACVPSYGGYSRGGAFTAPGYGARAGAMGGAAIATPGGEEAVFWNPAMLSHIEENRIGISYVNLVPGAKAYHSHVVYARSIKRTDADDIGRALSMHALGVGFGNLYLDLTDGSSYSENTLRFAYAYTPEYFVTFGAAFNILVSTSDFSSFDGTGTSVDAGVRLQLSEALTLGFVARNAASRLSYDDGMNVTLWRSYTFALATDEIPYLSTEADIVIAHGGISRYVLGIESLLYSDAIALRGGLSSFQSGEQRLVPHLGLGFKINRFQLNYNANLDSQKAFEDTHRFSVSAAL